MLKVEEARELTGGSLKHKGPWYKFRLCANYVYLDKKIENAAELGKTKVKFRINEIDAARKYFPVMRMYYENLGYYVAYMYDKAWNHSEFHVCWDYEHLDEEDKEFFREECDYQTPGYDHGPDKYEGIPDTGVVIPGVKYVIY